MTTGDFLSRQERFEVVGSTNDVVRGWLAEGTPEVCLAMAGEQSAGRGRLGRAWLAPPGAALLLSLGFRPAYLEPERLWRLGAVVALAMIDAAEEVGGLREGTLKLKWPNDIVADAEDGTVRKLAGVLGETDGLGTPDVRAAIGIGLNGDWPREHFPVELAPSMTSLSEVSGGRPFELATLLEAFLLRLEPRVLALREGRFDLAGWHDRQVTTGRFVTLDLPGAPRGAGSGTGGAGDSGAESGHRSELVRAVGVDGVSGALLVEDPAQDRVEPGVEREVLVAEVLQVRLAPDAAARRDAGDSGVTR